MPIKSAIQVKWPKATLLAAIMAVVGIIVVMSTLAATTFATAFEAESGTVGGTATKVANANASGGSAVKFGAATPTPMPTPTPTPGSEPPVGVPGTWTRTFTDEFNGSAIDATKWATNWFGGTDMNGYQKLASNISLASGSANLSVASDQSGAILTSNPNNGGGINGGFQFGTGTYVEARIYFPGNGTTIYNWPAWWTDPQSWPAGGEADIFEGLGTATSNYHSSSGANNSGTIPGTWSNAYHTYGLYRQAGKNDIYWDGQLVRSYTTNDGGALEYLILTSGPGNQTVTGAASQVKVDYVRAWHN